jgi:REP element-mobilizing transposase RayT
MPDAPPRLDIVFQKYHPPFFFVTFNTYHRKRLLCNAQVHEEFRRFAKSGEERGISVGRYVIMPDHIHLFVSGRRDFSLTQRV